MLWSSPPFRKLLLAISAMNNSQLFLSLLNRVWVHSRSLKLSFTSRRGQGQCSQRDCIPSGMKIWQMAHLQAQCQLSWSLQNPWFRLVSIEPTGRQPLTLRTKIQAQYIVTWRRAILSQNSYKNTQNLEKGNRYWTGKDITAQHVSIAWSHHSQFTNLCARL